MIQPKESEHETNEIEQAETEDAELYRDDAISEDDESDPRT